MEYSSNYVESDNKNNLDKFTSFGYSDMQIQEKHSKSVSISTPITFESGCLEQYYEEEKKMSFAGITFHGSSILGFADEKSTCNNNGILKEDPLRPAVRKIFSNDHFVIVLIGGNSFKISSENNCTEIYYIEDWMKANIEKFDAPRDLAFRLFLYIQKNAIEPFDNVEIMAGEFHEGISLFTEGFVGYNHFQLNTRIIDDIHIQFDGSKLYIEQCKANQNILQTADENELKKNLETMHENLNKNFAGSYNTVGSPWDIAKIESVK